jgi:hypothetical protein
MKGQQGMHTCHRGKTHEIVRGFEHLQPTAEVGGSIVSDSTESICMTSQFITASWTWKLNRGGPNRAPKSWSSSTLMRV